MAEGTLPMFYQVHPALQILGSQVNLLHCKSFRQHCNSCYGGIMLVLSILQVNMQCLDRRQYDQDCDIACFWNVILKIIHRLKMVGAGCQI